jgi:hypothetical protein
VCQKTEYKEYHIGPVCVGMWHIDVHNVASLVTTKQKSKMCSNLEYVYVFQNVLFYDLAVLIISVHIYCK